MKYLVPQLGLEKNTGLLTKKLKIGVAQETALGLCLIYTIVITQPPNRTMVRFPTKRLSKIFRV